MGSSRPVRSGAGKTTPCGTRVSPRIGGAPNATATCVRSHRSSAPASSGSAQKRAGVHAACSGASATLGRHSEMPVWSDSPVGRNSAIQNSRARARGASGTIRGENNTGLEEGRDLAQV